METFYIAFMGCPKRRLDCERIKNFFIANGLEQVAASEKADYIIISTCGLSEFHENECINLIRKAKRDQGRAIVYGCMPSMNPEKIQRFFDGTIVHTKEIEEFDKIFPHFAVKLADVPDANIQFEEMKKSPKERVKAELRKLDLYYPLKLYNVCLTLAERLREKVGTIKPGLFPNPLIHRIPLLAVSPFKSRFSLRISDGCMGNCSYCSIRTAIGRLRSKPIPQILEEMKQGLTKGEYTINIISSDTGSYGMDIGSNLPELLRAILGLNEKIVIDFMEDVHPIWICRYRSELIEVIKTGRVKSILTAVQSGSERILKLMNRGTNIENYIRVINTMKEAHPSLRMRTQIISGFPTETEQDFQDTVDLLRRCNFDEVDIFQYFETARMASSKITPKVPQEVAVDRMRRLQKSLSKYTITHTIYAGLQKK